MTEHKIRNLIIEKGDIFAEMQDELLSTNHIIVEERDSLRWKEDKDFTSANPDLNDLVEKMINAGLTKNDEEWRDVYRKMGYSLYGYWEVFYWEANNEDAEEYNYKKSVLLAKQRPSLSCDKARCSGDKCLVKDECLRYTDKGIFCGKYVMYTHPVGFCADQSEFIKNNIEEL